MERRLRTHGDGRRGVNRRRTCTRVGRVILLGAVSLLATTLLWVAGASADVLTFDGQTPGPVVIVTEGDYDVGGLAMTIEPGSTFCGSFVCPPAAGSFVGAAGNFVQIGRTDGQPFDLASLVLYAPIPAVQATITGTPSGGGAPIVATHFPTGGGFEPITLPIGFEDLLFATIDLGGLPFAIDNVTVGTAGSPPGPGGGTPGTLELLTDDRGINAFGERCYEDPTFYCDPYENESAQPSSDFAAFSENVSAGDGGAASQSSSVGTNGLAGVGSASGYSDIGYGIGRSTYDVTFRVDGAAVALTGTLEMFDFVGFGYGVTFVQLSRASGEVLYREEVDPYSSPAIIDYQGLLPPGDYRLEAFADGDVWIDTSFDFAMTADPVAAVPTLDPTAAPLLAAGLAWVGSSIARARRRSGLRLAK